MESLNAGQSRDVTAGQVDMTIGMPDEHYDHATKEEKIERREEYLVDV